MKGYDLDQARRALSALGDIGGRLVLVHSSLLHLGRCTETDAPAALYRALRDRLGPGGTLAVPAFTFAFCRGQTFDPAASPSEQMGVFSEFVRTRPEARRSPHPMQSLAVIGPLSERLCTPDTPSAFTPGGAFSQLVEHDALVLLLGATMQSVSLVHLVEERLEVPYRYWKTFSAPYRRDGHDASAEYRMYVRDLERKAKLTLAPIDRVMTERGLLRRQPLGAGQLCLFSARDFVAVTEEGLRADPEWLLASPLIPVGPA